MTKPDWTERHAKEALRAVGKEHLNDATVAVLRCPKQHRLFRVVRTGRGPLYLATVRSTPRHLPSSTRRALTGPHHAEATILGLHTAALLAALKAANLIEWWQATCECGYWRVPHDYVCDLARNPPPRPRGVPQLVPEMAVDERRVRRA